MTLENLVTIHKLKRESPDKSEFNGLVKGAIDRLTDSQNSSLSFSSRFELAYSAVHGLSLAALRASGFRTDKRYLVFLCLAYTTDMNKVSIKLFSKCHEKRNLAEYEGYYEEDEQLLLELIEHAIELLDVVRGFKVK